MRAAEAWSRKRASKTPVHGMVPTWYWSWHFFPYRYHRPYVILLQCLNTLVNSNTVKWKSVYKFDDYIKENCMDTTVDIHPTIARFSILPPRIWKVILQSLRSIPLHVQQTTDSVYHSRNYAVRNSGIRELRHVRFTFKKMFVNKFSTPPYLYIIPVHRYCIK